MKLKFPKRDKKFKKRVLYASPGLFWRILLLFAFAMIITAFVFGFLLFQRVNRDPIMPTSKAPANSQTIPKERIDAALKFFSDREKVSSDILYSPSPVVDPSF